MSDAGHQNAGSASSTVNVSDAGLQNDCNAYTLNISDADLQNTGGANTVNSLDTELQNAGIANTVNSSDTEFQNAGSANNVIVTDAELLDAALMSEVEEVIKINRNNVLQDMISTFTRSTISYCYLNFVFINERGEEEQGRGSGVRREVLSNFWREFYKSLTIGASEKVPNIRHDYQKPEWESIARILVFGYTKERYFPITLSRAFVASCLFKEKTMTPDWLLGDFYHYIPSDESEALKRGLSDECENPAHDEEVVDVLTTFFHLDNGSTNSKQEFPQLYSQ